MTSFSSNPQSLQGLLFGLTALLQQASMTPEQAAAQQAAQARQAAEAAARQAAVDNWANEQMARMNAMQASIQSSFSGTFGGLENSIGGFANQGFPRFDFSLNAFGTNFNPTSFGFSPTFPSIFGGSNFTPTFGGGFNNFGSPTFGAPIQVPNFFAQRSSFGRF